MNLQQLLSKTRQAVQDYNMISDNDHIAIGLSGGKDSLALLYSLNAFQKFYDKKFKISAITIDLGFGIQNIDDIEKLCQNLGLEFYIVHTNIATVVFESDYKDSPCSLCSKMRKGALNQKALEIGCNKVAFAHHMDDVVDTMMLSMFYESRLHTFNPVTKLDKTGLTLIRPFIYVKEADIKGFVYKQNINILKHSCPVDGHTKREYVKQILGMINKDNPGIKKRIFRAIQESNLEGWNENE